MRASFVGRRRARGLIVIDHLTLESRHRHCAPLGLAQDEVHFDTDHRSAQAPGGAPICRPAYVLGCTGDEAPSGTPSSDGQVTDAEPAHWRRPQLRTSPSHASSCRKDPACDRGRWSCSRLVGLAASLPAVQGSRLRFLKLTWSSSARRLDVWSRGRPAMATAHPAGSADGDGGSGAIVPAREVTGGQRPESLVSSRSQPLQPGRSTPRGQPSAGLGTLRNLKPQWLFAAVGAQVALDDGSGCREIDLGHGANSYS